MLGRPGKTADVLLELCARQTPFPGKCTEVIYLWNLLPVSVKLYVLAQNSSSDNSTFFFVAKTMLFKTFRRSVSKSQTNDLEAKGTFF